MTSSLEAFLYNIVEAEFRQQQLIMFSLSSVFTSGTSHGTIGTLHFQKLYH